MRPTHVNKIYSQTTDQYTDQVTGDRDSSVTRIEYRLDMRLNTKNIADRLCDEGLVECLSDALVNRLTHGPRI